jgi:hypothetical protein
LSQLVNENIFGKGVISLLVVAAVVFSIGAFIILDENVQLIFSKNNVESSSFPICENGLCYTNDEKGKLENILVQQGENLQEKDQVSQNENFSNLKLEKIFPNKALKQSGNKVSLFTEKDSFIREGVQNSNEGSNHVLKIMGSGPTNNRALISFNHADILDVMKGKTLASATLKLYVEGNNHNWKDGQLINIHQLETKWEEGNGINHDLVGFFGSDQGVTWSCSVNSICNDEWNGGQFKETPTDSVWISNQLENYWIKFDVTNDILDFQLSDQSFGWIIMKDNEDSEGQINISSRESQSHIPELVMVFSNE